MIFFFGILHGRVFMMIVSVTMYVYRLAITLLSLSAFLFMIDFVAGNYDLWHQGWFTALDTLHLLDSQSFEFLNWHITNTPDAANTLHKRIILPREAIPSHYFPSEKSRLGNTWVRQIRSCSCHHPTAATKCNEQSS